MINPGRGRGQVKTGKESKLQTKGDLSWLQILTWKTGEDGMDYFIAEGQMPSFTFQAPTFFLGK